MGCLTLPMSSGNTDRQIQFMMDLGSTIICCTPSYAAHIGEVLAEKGYKPEDNRLRAGIFGAEPWTEEMRRSIEQSLNLGWELLSTLPRSELDRVDDAVLDIYIKEKKEETPRLLRGISM